MDEDTIDLAVDVSDSPQDVDRTLSEMAMSREDRVLAQAIKG